MALIVQESIHELSLALKMKLAARSIVLDGQWRDAGSTITCNGFHVGLVLLLHSRASKIGSTAGPYDSTGDGWRRCGVQSEGLRLVEICKVFTSLIKRI